MVPTSIVRHITIQAYLYDADGTDQAVDFNDGTLASFSDRQLFWIDVVGSDKAEIELVGKTVHLHRESIKNLLNSIGRPRLDQFGEYFQVNVIAVEPARKGKEDKLSFVQIPLDFFSGPNYVVTTHAEELKFLHDFDDRVREDSGLGALDSASFLAALLDWHITGYFRVLDELLIQVEV